MKPHPSASSCSIRRDGLGVSIETQSDHASEDYGTRYVVRRRQLEGGGAEHNANELVRVFTGDDKGAHRDALLMGTSLDAGSAGESRMVASRWRRSKPAAAIDDAATLPKFLDKLKAHFLRLHERLS